VRSTLALICEPRIILPGAARHYYRSNNFGRSSCPRRWATQTSWKLEIKFSYWRPYGISQTLTAGHVSGRHCLNRNNESSTPVEFLQTDRSRINGGSSGSPMFNLNGEVVGSISRLMSRSGGSEGLHLPRLRIPNAPAGSSTMLVRHLWLTDYGRFGERVELATGSGLSGPTRRRHLNRFESRPQSRNAARHHTRNRFDTWWRCDSQR